MEIPYNPLEPLAIETIAELYEIALEPFKVHGIYEQLETDLKAGKLKGRGEPIGGKCFPNGYGYLKFKPQSPESLKDWRSVKKYHRDLVSLRFKQLRYMELLKGHENEETDRELETIEREIIKEFYSLFPKETPPAGITELEPEPEAGISKLLIKGKTQNIKACFLQMALKNNKFPGYSLNQNSKTKTFIETFKKGLIYDGKVYQEIKLNTKLLNEANKIKFDEMEPEIRDNVIKLYELVFGENPII